jgi:hypothetical protein
MPEKIYRKNPDIVFRKIANELILVPIRQNVGDLQSIYTLNETGARIWDLIDGKKNLSQIKKIINEEFEASAEEVDVDLKLFLSQLQGVGGILEV